MKVRFAPSPTGSLHIGNALGAVANRNFGGTFLLRIDDTDPARNVPGGEEAILEDLRWLGVEWDEGPVRQSERSERYREAAAGLPQRFEGVMLWRDDGSPTYHLASVVDDIDFGITHVIRGNDHRPNERLHRALAEALGATPPEYIHHGLVLGPDGRKLSKRAAGASVASLREAGIPAEAVRAYLDELDLPRHDVRLDLDRIRSLAVETIARLPDEELAARLDVPVAVVPAVRGAHELNEARSLAAAVLIPPSDKVSLGEGDRETLARFRELRAAADGDFDAPSAKAIVRELKAVGGNLRAVRRALTGRDSGPELWAVIAALPRDETLRRIDAAL
jgi:glutamyl/glutaminyl-tRNA synthetase